MAVSDLLPLLQIIRFATEDECVLPSLPLLLQTQTKHPGLTGLLCERGGSSVSQKFRDISPNTMEQGVMGQGHVVGAALGVPCGRAAVAQSCYKSHRIRSLVFGENRLVITRFVALACQLLERCSISLLDMMPPVRRRSNCSPEQVDDRLMNTSFAVKHC